jgi:hypothetical protein
MERLNMQINLESVEIIEYEKSFVAFLDVLGFKKMVLSRKTEDKQKIDQYFGIVNSAIKYLKNIDRKKKIGSIIISDSIILSVPHGSTKHDNLKILRSLCIAVGIIQQNLSLKNIWLRGAICSGFNYFNAERSQVVGPAFINAYILEDKSAINPRVIIDSQIINDFTFSNATDFIDAMNKSEEGGLKYSNWGSNILFNWSHPNGEPVNTIDQDVPLFIDYLSPLAEENGNKLIQIVENLEKNLYQSVSSYKKYRWVADYLRSIFKREILNDNLASSEATYRLSNL